MLPTRNDVDTFKRTLLPKELSSDDKQTSSPVNNVIKDTVESLLDISEFCAENHSIHVEGKFGLDGSGNHNYRHQFSDPQDADLKGTNYICSFWCPLEIKDSKNQVIWTNPTPNSITFARPVILVKAKETRESVKEYFKATLSQLPKNETQPILSKNGLQIFVKTEISMVDGKMVDLLVGDSGAFCHYCKCSRSDANDLVCILHGFTIDKNYNDVLSTWRRLENGKILYKDTERHGQCHEPIVESDVKFFAILHQKLRALDHCLKILYHIVGKQTHTWSEQDIKVKTALKTAKKKVIQNVREKTGMLLDSSTSSGGNTNNGPLADRFFSPKERKSICSIILKTEDQDSFSTLLSKFNILLSINQHVDVSKKVDPDKVKEVGYGLMIFHKQTFPWAMLSPSVHQMCAHAWELFMLTGGSPIAKYSEQSSESWNKYIKAYKSGTSCKARQMSLQINTHDIYCRLMIRTHPIIASKKRLLQCGLCGKFGHTTRGCKVDVNNIFTEEKMIIQECFL
jgi:hypothetical protein